MDTAKKEFTLAFMKMRIGDLKILIEEEQKKLDANRNCRGAFDIEFACTLKELIETQEKLIDSYKETLPLLELVVEAISEK